MSPKPIQKLLIGVRVLRNNYLEGFFYRCGSRGGGDDFSSAWYLFRIPMIHRFMTSHPVAKLLLCFSAKHQDGRPDVMS